MTDFARDLVAQPAERHIIYGDTRTGKSCHVDWEMRAISNDRPECAQVLADTKPRFRAETEPMPFNPKGRRSAAWRYEHWQKGPVVPNSVHVNIWADHPFRGLWRRPGEIAIMQSGDAQDWRRMLRLLAAFCDAQMRERERHVTVDEALDWYGRNTFGIDSKNDVFYKICRAGGERNIGLTMGGQYVFGIPILIRKMFSRCSLYHLAEDREMRYLNGIGIPDDKSPEGNFVFKQWTKEPGGTVKHRFTGSLILPESYLEQLAAA